MPDRKVTAAALSTNARGRRVGTRGLSLHGRLTLTYVGLVALSLAVTALVVGILVNGFFLDRMRQDLTWQARLIDERVARERSPAGVPLGSLHLQSLAITLGQVSLVRITLMDQKGVVLADSWENPGLMENHATRPEMRAALAGQVGSDTRRSKTVGADLFYVAVPAEQARPEVAVVRLAVKLDSITGFLLSVRATLLAVFFIVSLAGLVLSLRLAASVGRPVSELAAVAARLAEGDLAARAAPDPSAPPDLRALGQTLNGMADKLERTVRDLAFEKSRMERVIANLHDAVVAMGSTGLISLFNPAAERLFSTTATGAIGRRPMEVFQHHRLDALFRLAAEERRTQVADIELRRPDRLIHAVAVPVLEGLGPDRTDAVAIRVTAVVAVFHDMTEKSQAELLRREFVAAVSHELRTPVASLRALAETLAAGAIDDREAARGFLESMVSEADRLTRLVEDLLDLSRLEAGLLELRLQPTSLNALAASVEALFRERAEEAGISLVTELATGPVSVQGDPDRLLQVASNLVENAIKFTPRRGKVTVRTVVEEDHGRFEVADTGVGIDPADLPHVFDRFFRADRSRDRRTGGYGLGLAISRYLVEAHGGRIFAESRPDGGSTFSFILPVTEAGPAAATNA